MQVVFQDPFSSLNPRMRVRDILLEPMRNFGLHPGRREAAHRRTAGHRPPAQGRRRALAARILLAVSGRRIGIARALAAEPDLIVCDEAVSALDVSVKAQIVNLLQDLQAEFGLALLFISHDLAIVEHMTHRVAVMYLGRIVEVAEKRRLFAAPKHPYTEAPLSRRAGAGTGGAAAAHSAERRCAEPDRSAAGCRFHTRCPRAFDRCRREEPMLRAVAPGHLAACHLHDEPAATVRPPAAA